MKRFENVLLVSDLDGTLLDSEKRIGARTIASVRSFIEQGGRFTVATGRAVAATRRFFDLLPINAPYICLDGAQLYSHDTHRLIVRNSLPASSEELIELAERCDPSIGIEIYAEEEAYVLKRTEMTDRHFRIVGMEPRYADRTKLPMVWDKINLTGEPEQIDKLEATLQTMAEKYTLIRSMPIFYEITSLNSNKGFAVQQLAKHCGIKAENIYTVGDSPNDLTMLKQFHSFAPSNADDSAKEQATQIVCDYAQDAVAEVIELLSARYSNGE